jgi:hypothetical protein
LTEQDLNENQKAIRLWVLDNPRKKDNDVVKAMKEKGQCSRMTTLKEIEELKERQILEDVRAKPNNFSCLVARDENEYTRIYQEITKIKAVIDTMDKPIEKLFLQRAEWGTNSSTEEATRGAPGLQNLQIQIESKYRQSYSLMLQFLWYRTNDIIQSEKDKQTLHTMIVNLMMKMNRQFWHPRQLNEIFKFFTFDPGILKPTLSKKMGITKELIEKLNATQEDFVRRFLN